ncbi:hypothetical protein ACLOJK_001290 [Asimina triloba]
MADNLTGDAMIRMLNPEARNLISTSLVPDCQPTGFQLTSSLFICLFYSVVLLSLASLFFLPTSPPQRICLACASLNLRTQLSPSPTHSGSPVRFRSAPVPRDEGRGEIGVAEDAWAVLVDFPTDPGSLPKVFPEFLPGFRVHWRFLRWHNVFIFFDWGKLVIFLCYTASLDLKTGFLSQSITAIADENRGGSLNGRESNDSVERNDGMGLESMPAVLRRDEPKLCSDEEGKSMKHVDGSQARTQDTYNYYGQEYSSSGPEKGQAKGDSRPQKLQKTGGFFDRRMPLPVSKVVLSRSKEQPHCIYYFLGIKITIRRTLNASPNNEH